MPSSISAEEKVDYLLAVMATASNFEPDYHKLAPLTGAKNAKQAQRKFKSMVDSSERFKLANGQVVLVVTDEDEEDDDAKESDK